MIKKACKNIPLIAAMAFGHTGLTEANPRQESAEALQSLANSMNWVSVQQCAPTYDRIQEQLRKAEEKISTATIELYKDDPLKNFLDTQVSTKLLSLTDELKYLRERCLAEDYDASAISLERPSRLQQMIQEWRSTILWASDVILKDNLPDTDQVLKSETLVQPLSPVPLQKFKDCADTYCQELIVIPTGSFIMGGTDEEATAGGVNPTVASWERPRHTVTISKPIATLISEVTLGSFRKFVQETSYTIPTGCTSLSTSSSSTGLATLVFVDEYNYENPGYPQEDDSPVVCVRREDAREYANWLSKKTGHRYRLPTEAEWEFIARGGTDTTYFWGNSPDEACLYANTYDQTSDEENRFGYQRFECRDAFPYTAPVASFLPNNFGVHDVLANAREWVDDCWHYSYRSAPTNGSRWGEENNGLCNFGVLRGGAWAYNTFNVRIAYRNAYFSSQAKSSMWGFRLVRDIEGPE
ncbi:TPA: formylglycine-generating enzyme family protein [Pseudomonas aeruginosa]